MKKLINRPEDAERESLKGLALAHADLLRVEYEPMYVYRADAPSGKVALLSGGGSGHEPMHTGFVGPGMLDAACPGAIFTSPVPDQMVAAAKAVDGWAGVVFIIKNYSGDVMNFEMAAEMVAAEGIQVRTVLVDDDVAVKDSLYTQGRRGVGTTVLVEKIGGAAAASGHTLDEVADICTRVALNGRSMGVALTSCTVPAAGKPTFEIGDADMEAGVGIHGEPGRERRPMAPADAVVEEMINAILTDGAYTRSIRRCTAGGGWEDAELTSTPFQEGDRLLAFVNSLGGTPQSELYIAYRTVHRTCLLRGFQIVRSLIGPYMTSLDMQGCTITLLRVDDEMLRLWDAPVHTASLRWG